MLGIAVGETNVIKEGKCTTTQINEHCSHLIFTGLEVFYKMSLVKITSWRSPPVTICSKVDNALFKSFGGFFLIAILLTGQKMTLKMWQQAGIAGNCIIVLTFFWVCPSCQRFACSRITFHSNATYEWALEQG